MLGLLTPHSPFVQNLWNICKIGAFGGIPLYPYAVAIRVCTEPLDPPYFLANLLYAAFHITHESIFRCIVYSTKKR